MIDIPEFDIDDVTLSGTEDPEGVLRIVEGRIKQLEEALEALEDLPEADPQRPVVELELETLRTVRGKLLEEIDE